VKQAPVAQKDHEVLEAARTESDNNWSKSYTKTASPQLLHPLLRQSHVLDAAHKACGGSRAKDEAPRPLQAKCRRVLRQRLGASLPRFGHFGFGARKVLQGYLLRWPPTLYRKKERL
jgi:hypothetical protein